MSNKPIVTLEHYTPLRIIDLAIGMCHDKCTDRTLERIDRVVNKMKHESTAEHCNFVFAIENISRAVLIELTRHRISSFSVKSTRYTLKELKEEDPFYTTDIKYDIENKPFIYETFDVNRASKYIKLVDNEQIDKSSTIELELLRRSIESGISNDLSKYNLPECYKTKLVYTANVRSLRNFLSLRTKPDALWEIRELAYAIYKEIPEEFEFLFESKVYKEE